MRESAIIAIENRDDGPAQLTQTHKGLPGRELERPKAVIVCAGAGNRLRQFNTGVPKPLTKLLGLTLVERAILSCREVGITNFLAVVGYQKEAVIPHLKWLANQHRVSIQIVENPSWRLGNGTSVLACEPHCKDPFLLLMCDHLFDPAILERLMEREGGSDACWLAVDLEVKKGLSIEDATKVRIENERIAAIGKEISPFNGVDTGLFLCRPVIFDALRAAQREGDFSLSGGVQKLIDNQKMRWLPANGLFWQDVDTVEDLNRARESLLAGLTKPGEDGWVSRYLNRRLSRRISAHLASWRVSPNLISIGSFLICLIAGGLFSLWRYPSILLAGLLTQFTSVLDGCDGEVARLNLRVSRFGGWLDTVLDRYGDLAIAAGITYGFWQSHPGLLPWLGGLIAAAGFLMVSYTKKEFQIRYQRPLAPGFATRLIKRDLRLLLLFLGAVAARPFETLVLVGLISHLGVGWLFLQHLKRGPAISTG